LKWYLKIYPNGQNAEAKDYVSIYLFLIDSTSATQVSAKVEFCIYDSKKVDQGKKG
jgi:hypothetical protein